MKKIVKLTEKDLTRLVKRVIKENKHHNIEVGDEVFIPHMEYNGTVLKISDDGTKVKIEGPMGIETFSIDDVEKKPNYSKYEDF